MTNNSVNTKNLDRVLQVDAFTAQIKIKSDRLMNYFLISFFIGGLALAFFFITWNVAICVG